MANPTDKQIRKFIEKYPNLPNPKHEPIKFMYYWKIYNYEKLHS